MLFYYIKYFTVIEQKMASVFNTCIFSEQIKNSAKRYESEIMPLKLCLVFFIWMYTASGHIIIALRRMN